MTSTTDSQLEREITIAVNNFGQATVAETQQKWADRLTALRAEKTRRAFSHLHSYHLPRA